MKKGDILEGRIESLHFPNKGILIEDGRKVTIKGTFPGQVVKYRVTKKKSGMAEGTVLEVLEKSELEDACPKCAHFGQCGGCTYQTLSYENQLKLKEKMVKDLLDGVIVNPETFNWQGVVGSPVQEEYRNKMEFTFGDFVKDGPMTLGLHKKGSFYDILQIEDCKIVTPAVNEIIKYTLRFYQELGVPYYRRMKHVGVLRNLVVRQSAFNKEIMLNLVTTTKMNLNEDCGFMEQVFGEKASELSSWDVKEKLCLDSYVAGLKDLEKSGAFGEATVASIIHTDNDSFADAVICDRMEVIYGSDHLTEEVLGLSFNISPFSFFQTNTKGCEVLYSKAREFIMEVGGEAFSQGDEGAFFNDKIIFDLYSGTGTIAQLLAPVAKKVIGIEIIEEAVEAARENAKLNGLSNCEFLAGDVFKMLDEVEEKPDFIVLDPPRDGINPKALEKIINYEVENIIYISCKPTSLARDLVTLQARGYMPIKGCCIDQFPGTQHVETVCLLSKK